MSTRTSPWIIPLYSLPKSQPHCHRNTFLSLSLTHQTKQHKTKHISLSRLYLYLTPDTVSEPDKSKATSLPPPFSLSPPVALPVNITQKFSSLWKHTTHTSTTSIYFSRKWKATRENDIAVPQVQLEHDLTLSHLFPFSFFKRVQTHPTIRIRHTHTHTPTHSLKWWRWWFSTSSKLVA